MTGVRVLMMAGGTGGHVFPALAVADALRDGGAEVVWMGTRAGMEADLVPKHGYPLEWISVAGLRGKGLASWLVAPMRLARAVWQALIIVRRRSPQVVVGMGGFAAGPGGLAAWLLRRPLVIHEQNAVAGLTNRALARLADVALEAFPGTFPSGRGAHCVGNPVRAAIHAIAEPAERLRGRKGPIRLLVLGGSLGALAINRMVPHALAQFTAERRPQVRHQAGRTLEQAQSAYTEAGITDIELEAFIDDMAAAYAWADLVICRAGALTVAELAAAGLPALLVPFPHAVDDHQTENGRYLTERGAAVLVQQSELTPETLAERLSELCADREHLRAMAEAARAAAWPNATDDIVGHCLTAARRAA